MIIGGLMENKISNKRLETRIILQGVCAAPPSKFQLRGCRHALNINSVTLSNTQEPSQMLEILNSKLHVNRGLHENSLT